MKKLFALILFLPIFLQAQIKVKDLPTKSSNYKQGDNIIIDDSAGVSGATKKITVGSFKSNYGFTNGTISGLTTNYIPYATSGTTLGNTSLYYVLDSIFLTEGSGIYSPLSKTQ